MLGASWCLASQTGSSVLPASLALSEPLTHGLVQNWDGTGGNGAAMRHFEATGQKYPLVVKLGTITPSGADVFSYAHDENDMVTDAKLVRLCRGIRTSVGVLAEQS